MIHEFFIIEGSEIGSHILPIKYGWSHIYLCTVCGEVFGKKEVRCMETGNFMSWIGLSGVCLDCKPPSIYCPLPGGIPRFDLLRYSYPESVIKYQFNLELEYMESLCSIHPSQSLEPTSS